MLQFAMSYCTGSAILLAAVLMLTAEFHPAAACPGKITGAIKSAYQKVKEKITGTGPGKPAYPKGCFADKKDMRDLPTFAGYSEQMSTDYCQKMCLEWKTKYFGLQDGNGCYCGNTFGAHGEAKDGCTLHCAGKDEEMCGGTLFNSVYEVMES